MFSQDVEHRAEFSQEDVERPVVVRQCYLVSPGAQKLLVVLWLAQYAGQAHEFARGPPLVLFHPLHQLAAKLLFGVHLESCCLECGFDGHFVHALWDQAK